MRERGHFFALEGPLNAVPTQRQMHAANLSGFQLLVRRLGGNPCRILERHNLDSFAIEDPDTYIDRADAVDALEYCSSFFNDSLFGLHLAEIQSPDVFGSVTALARAAPRVDVGLQCYVDYIAVVHSSEGELEVAREGDSAELRWCAPPDFELSPQAIYQAVILGRKILHMLVGRGFRPDYVRMAVDVRRKDVQAIEEKVGCRLQLRTGFNAKGSPIAYAIGFPVGVLGRPVASANRATFHLLKGYLDRIKACSRATIVEQVEACVRDGLSSGRCTLACCAKKLGIPVRTLQWRLAESGVSFSDILEKQRIELAKDYLEDDRLKLEEIAALPGYSEQASFGRAFKRWTGLTPQAFRVARERPPETALGDR